MRPSQLFFSIGLASAGVVPRDNKLAARQIQTWNGFSTPVDELDACVVFGALEFLAFELIEPTQGITSEAATQVFVAPELQGGPLVLDMRAMMIWTAILERFAEELRVTNVWSTNTQLRVAECYLGYSQQAGNFLTALLQQASDFSDTDPAKCLMYDKIEALYVAYDIVATLIYGQNSGIPADIEYLVTDSFTTAQGFNTPYTAPTPGQSIADYLAENDVPLPSSQNEFADNQAAWQCGDFKGEFTGDPTLLRAKGPRANFAGKAGQQIEELGQRFGALEKIVKDADTRAQQAAAQKAQEDAAKKAQEDAAKKAQEEAAKKAQEDAAKKAQEDAAKKAQEDAKKAQDKRVADEKARKEKEEKERKEKERKGEMERKENERKEEERKKNGKKDTEQEAKDRRQKEREERTRRILEAAEKAWKEKEKKDKKFGDQLLWKPPM